MAIVFFVAWVLAFTFIAPALFQWLWNKTVPDIFKLCRISYWQAFRLLLISTLLFGGPPTFMHFNA